MPRICLPVVVFALACPVAVEARQPAPPTARVRLEVRNTTRIEAWRFFDPHPGGGRPDYTFPANRLMAKLDFRGPRLEATAAVQYVQFSHLPVNATGPGALGTGPQYFDHAGRTDSRQVYLRTLQVRFKDLVRGVTLQVGRFGYASGAESASGDQKIEAVKRQRLDSRLIGEFEWSLYQRAFDGARLDVVRPRWHATASWFEPTQGGFEEEAGARLRHVGIAAATFSLKPGPRLRHTDWQGFGYHYDDTRPVRSRPDNTLRAAAAVDVHVTSLGTSLVGAYPAGEGQIDVLGWFVWQRGRWYGERHEAGAAALEGGYQWTAARGRPWLRAGWFYSSGDRDPNDNRHGTFFQMLPTARRYALSTVYNLMNLSEVFAQALLRPRPSVGLRLDVHRLRLAQASDLWYAGSGATQRAGTTFGFAGRRSNGSTALGTMVEGAADWTLSPHVAVNGYAGRMKGGDVVAGTFARTRLLFSYIETVVSF